MGKPIPLSLQDFSAVHIKTMTQNRGSQGAHQGMSWQHSLVSMFVFWRQEKQKFGLKRINFYPGLHGFLWLIT